jgi:acyl-coenzyme A synthetase/AMP-(fatty) acid ligase
MKISLAEIDEAALTLAGVQEAASYGVPDPETGERLVLAVRCTSPEAESFETIVSRLRSGGLATWKLPEQVVFWGRPLPRTASGKILRPELVAGAAGQPAGLAMRLRRLEQPG